jgi:hypothetical protein
VDALDQVAQLGSLHLSGDYLCPGTQSLEHDRTQLNDAQRCLAPSDDGVDTWTVSVVRADPAVSVAVQCHGITAGTALSFAGDEVDERVNECLLRGLSGFHGKPDSLSARATLYPGNVVLNTFTGGGTASGGGSFRVCQPITSCSRGQIGVLSVKIAQMDEISPD